MRSSPNPLTRVGISPAASPTNNAVPNFLGVAERFSDAARPLGPSIGEALTNLAGTGASIFKEVDAVRAEDDKNRALTDAASKIKAAKTPAELQAHLNSVLPDKTLSTEYRIAYRELMGVELARRYDASLGAAMKAELDKSETQDPKTGLFYQPMEAEQVQANVWKEITADLQPEVAKSVFFRGALNDAANGSNLMQSAKYTERRKEQIVAQTGIMYGNQMSDAITRAVDEATLAGGPTDYAGVNTLLLAQLGELHASGHPQPGTVGMKAVLAAVRVKLEHDPGKAAEMLNALGAAKVAGVALDQDVRFVEDFAQMRREIEAEENRRENDNDPKRQKIVVDLAASDYFKLAKGKAANPEALQKLIEGAEANTAFESDAERMTYTRQLRALHHEVTTTTKEDIRNVIDLHRHEIDRLKFAAVQGKPGAREALDEAIERIGTDSPSAALQFRAEVAKEFGPDTATDAADSLVSDYMSSAAEILKRVDNIPGEIPTALKLQTAITEAAVEHRAAVRSQDPERIKAAVLRVKQATDEVTKYWQGISTYRNEAIARFNDFTEPFDASAYDAALREGWIHPSSNLQERRGVAAKKQWVEARREVEDYAKEYNDIAQRTRLTKPQIDAETEQIGLMLRDASDGLSLANDPADKTAVDAFRDRVRTARMSARQQMQKAASEGGLSYDTGALVSAFPNAENTPATGDAITRFALWDNATYAGEIAAADRLGVGELPTDLYGEVNDDTERFAKEQHYALLKNNNEGWLIRGQRLAVAHKRGFRSEDLIGGVLHYGEIANGGISLLAMPTPKDPKPKVDITVSKGMLRSLDPNKTGFFYNKEELLSIQERFVNNDPAAMDAVQTIMSALMTEDYSVTADRDSVATTRFFEAQRRFYALPAAVGRETARVGPTAPTGEAKPATKPEEPPKPETQPTPAESQPSAKVPPLLDLPESRPGTEAATQPSEKPAADPAAPPESRAGAAPKAQLPTWDQIRVKEQDILSRFNKAVQERGMSVQIRTETAPGGLRFYSIPQDSPVEFVHLLMELNRLQRLADTIRDLPK